MEDEVGVKDDMGDGSKGKGGAEAIWGAERE